MIEGCGCNGSDNLCEYIKSVIPVPVCAWIWGFKLEWSQVQKSPLCVYVLIGSPLIFSQSFPSPAEALSLFYLTFDAAEIYAAAIIDLKY